MKRLWMGFTVLLVMFMLCLWAAAPVANATPTDIETPSITNIVPADLQMADCMAHCPDSVAPIDSVASVDVPAYAAVIGEYGTHYAKSRCCDPMNFIDNSKTTALKPMNTTILAEALIKMPDHYLIL